MLTVHEKDLDILKRRADQEQELDRNVSSDMRLIQKEVSDLKSIAAENRAAIRNLFISVVLAMITAYLSKYLK
jgi:CHASE3 domain sensor protein